MPKAPLGDTLSATLGDILGVILSDILGDITIQIMILMSKPFPSCTHLQTEFQFHCEIAPLFSQ